MVTRWRHLLSRERELKMIWQVEREGRRSYLAGTAHFFPYQFRRSLRRYIGRVDTVLFEGPLDEAGASTVTEYGSRGAGGVSLLDALDAGTIGRITGELGSPPQTLSSHTMVRSLFGVEPDVLDWDRIQGWKPWMAFFHIWSHYLRKNGWTCTMELDAVRIAGTLGKRVHFLETIEEQLEALDNVPLERFVHFLQNVNWTRSRREHLDCYLRGDLESLLDRIRGFPTLCDSIIGKRDPVLCARMQPFLARGRTIAFVGTAHCRGIKALLLADGYTVEPALAV